MKTITERVMEKAEFSPGDLAQRLENLRWSESLIDPCIDVAEMENARLLPLIRQLADSNEKLVDVVEYIGGVVGHSEGKDVPIIYRIIKDALAAHEADMLKILEGE